MKKRLLSLLMTLALCLSLVPFTAVPAGAAWSGDGSPGNPYQIDSAEQLAKFRDIVNGENGETKNTAAWAKLTENIDLNKEAWTPIGTDDAHAYTGTFDGQGFAVRNLNVTLSGDVLYAGLFGCIGKDGESTGTVQNLSVEGTVALNTTADGNVCLGGVAGLNGGTIQCVSWSGSVTGTRKTGDNGDLDGGGVTGRNDGTVSRSRALGKVGLGYSGDSAFHTRAGGVVGYNAQNALLEDSFSDGAVSAERTNTTSGKALAGGVAGSNEGTVKRGYHFRGEVTAKHENNNNNNDNNAVAGGVAGFGGSTPNLLTACYWLTGTAGRGIREGQGQATELTAEQFKDISSFYVEGSSEKNWDFTKTWTMGPEKPELQCFVTTVTTWEECYLAMQEDGKVVLGADLSPRPNVDANSGVNSIADDSPLTVPQGVAVTLDLNGHTIDRKLTIEKKNGCVLRAEGELTVIDGSSGQKGKITGGYNDGTGEAANGGGVYVGAKGDLTLTAGTVTGSKAPAGGGVYVKDGGMFRVSGTPKVTGNTETAGGTAGNVWLPDGTVITIDDTLDKSAKLAVTTETAPTASKPVVITSGLKDKGTADNFASDSGYTVSLNGDGEAVLALAHVHDFTYSASGAVITAACGNSGCPLPGGKVALTLVKPAKAEYNDDGIPAATLNEQELAAFNAATGKSVKMADIVYYKATKRGETYTRTGKALLAAPENAGDYVAELTVEGKTASPNVTSVTASVGWTIAKADPGTPKVTMEGYTYGGTVSTPGIGTYDGGGTVTYYYNDSNSTPGGTKWENIKPDTLDAGDWYLFAEIAATDNFNGYTTAAEKFTIAKAAGPEAADIEKYMWSPTDVTVVGADGQEYTIALKGAAADWDSAVLPTEGYVTFDGLTPATEYVLYTRAAEDKNHEAGPVKSLDYLTDLSGMEIRTDTPDGDLLVGVTVTAIPDPEDAQGLTWQWYHDTVTEPEGGGEQHDLTPIPGADAPAYTTVAGDAGSRLAVKAFKAGQEVGGSEVFGEPVSFGTVIFDSRGGSAVEKLEGLVFGDKVTKPAIPIRSGYVFDGWFTNEELTEAWDFDNDTMDHVDLTLYAKWTARSSGGGGGVVSGQAIDVTVSAGGKVKVTPNSARAGETVTAVLQPDQGYQAAGLTVTDKTGKDVPATQVDEVTYTFTMPDTAVTVTPVFEKITGPDNPDTPDDPDLPAGDVSGRFRDVSRTAWYHDAVQWAVDNGLMNGVSADRFAPNDTATRAMVVTMVWRMAGQPVVDYLMPYTDVSQDAWYAEAVRWAASAGAVKGTSDTTFSPNEPVTREQLAAILYRYVQAQGKGFEGAWAFPLDFSDAADVSEYANEAMHWMVMHGVITGMDDGTLAPKANATRAQIAAIFMRFCGELEK